MNVVKLLSAPEESLVPVGWVRKHLVPEPDPSVVQLRVAIEVASEYWVGVMLGKLDLPLARAGRLPQDTLTNWLKRAASRAGLRPQKGFGFHSFRRRMVNDLKNKVSPTEIAALGGWTNPDTVVRVYMAPDTDRLREVQSQRNGLGLAGEGYSDGLFEPEPDEANRTSRDSKTDSNSGEGAGGPKSDPTQDAGKKEVT